MPKPIATPEIAPGRKPPASTKDEPYKLVDVNPASARASADSLIQQLRSASGQPELRDRARDRAKAMRWWSIFDSVLVAVVVWALIALAVVFVAYRR